MWNSSQGGGFMSGGSLSSPSVAGSGGKPKRAQNIVPVEIREVLEAPEEGFTVEGLEVGMVVVLGRILSVERATTKTTYQIEDESGQVDVIQWMDEGSTEKEHMEGKHVRVIGSIRTQGEKKHIMAFKIVDVSDQAEMDFHALNIVYTHLKLKQLSDKQTGQTGLDNSGLSNSLMGGGFGGNTISAVTSSNQSFGNKNYDIVYTLIKATVEDQGIDIGTIFDKVKTKMSKAEMESSIEFLSSEGHIYSTIDEEHFKSTDGE